MQVTRFKPAQPGWEAYVTHLKASKQASWVLDDNDQPLSDQIIYLGIEERSMVVGSLTLKLQPLVIPDSEWAKEMDKSLVNADGEALNEAFVQTFFVDEAFRRQGMGEMLQQAGLSVSRELGAYQMRSWSSLDKPANYQLKLKLGFAVHPAISEAGNGLKVSGIYFVKSV